MFSALSKGAYPIVTLIVALFWTIPGEAAEPKSGTKGSGYEIVFKGNKALGETELRKVAADELRDFELHGYRPSDVDDAAFQMELAYRKEGYAFAIVDYDLEQVQGKVVVTFTVSEGPRVILQKVEFLGNTAFGENELLPFFEGEKTGFLGLGKLVFVRSSIDGALSEIRDYYRTQGYLDVFVEKPEFVFSEDRTSLTVKVKIQEGTQYVIHDIIFKGDVIQDADKSLKNLRSELVGLPYFSRRKLALQSQVAEIYGTLGYPDVTVDVREREEDKAGHIILDAAITSGSLATIAGVSIRGNEKTREKFIRSRLKLGPGDQYSIEKRRESFQELYATGLFSSVDLKLDEREGTEGKVLTVEVKEAPSKEFFLEPGWGSYERLRMKAGFREKNLFGTGRIFGSEIRGSLKAQGVNVSLTDPWFLNTKITAELPVYFDRREEPSYTRKDLGTAILFSTGLTKHLTVSAGYNFRSTDLSDVTKDVSAKDVGNDYNLASVTSQITYDTRDDLFFPTKGQRGFFSADHADKALGGDLTFTRLTTGARSFFRLAGHTILGLRYTTGLIIPGREEVSVPISEKFFNGGANTVRSFRYSELGPKDASGDPVGGLAFNVFNIELRQRMIGNLVGTLFFDYGNVSPNRSRFEEGKPPYDSRSEVLSDTFDDFFKDFRPGIGVGLQYLLPVGPARLDFAFNPDADNERDEDSFVVHLTVGMAF